MAAPDPARDTILFDPKELARFARELAAGAAREVEPAAAARSRPMSAPPSSHS